MSDFRRSVDSLDGSSDAKFKGSKSQITSKVNESSKVIRMDTPTKEDTNYYQSERGKLAPSEQSKTDTYQVRSSVNTYPEIKLKETKSKHGMNLTLSRFKQSQANSS